MWKNSAIAFVWLVALNSSAMAEPMYGVSAYVREYKGEYLLSRSAPSGRTRVALPPAEGKALLERLLNPSHMVVTGFGDEGDAFLRAGDDTREALFALLGPAKRLPDWRRCEYAFGYVSARLGDSTVVLVNMCDPCLDNSDYVEAIFICDSPTVLPKEYRPHLKRFTASMGIHAGLATQSGLKLGMTPAEVDTVLGKPMWKGKNAYSYGALGNIKFSPKFLIARWHWPEDVESKHGGDEHIIKVWFQGGRVSGFLVRKMYDV